MSAYQRVVILGLLGWITVYGGRTVLYPMLPLVAGEFGLSNTVTGTLVSAYFITFALVQIPAGLLGARLGYKPILVTFFAVGSLALGAIAVLAHNFGWLLALLALYGLGAGVYDTASWGVVLQGVPKHIRGRGASSVTTGMSIGLGLGLIIAGPLYIALQSWRLPLLVFAIPAFVVALAYGMLAPRSLPEKAARIRNPLDLLRDWEILRISLVALCSLYAFNVVLTWGPTFLLSQRNMSVAQAGLLTGLVALGALPGVILSGRLSDRIGRRKVSLVQFPLTALIVLSLPMLRAPWLLGIGLLLYGLLGKLAWDAIAIAWLSDHVSLEAGDQLGPAVGLYSVFAMLGAVVSPTVSGWLRDLTGSLDLALYLAAGALGLATLLLLVPDRKNTSVAAEMAG